MQTSHQQTSAEIYALIRQAIFSKDIVALEYRGSVREMCPHVLGKTKGVAYALMYQFAGETKGTLKHDGSPANWRCMRLDDISHVALRKANGKWHTASNFSAMQNCVSEVDLRVETRAA